MDEKKLKNAVRVDYSTLFSENIGVEQIFSTADGKTLFVLRVENDTRVSFSIDCTNPNIVLKTLFGALRGFTLYSCPCDVAKFLCDMYDVKHIKILYHYEKD